MLIKVHQYKINLDICPIILDVIEEPVIMSNGFMYEKITI